MYRLKEIKIDRKQYLKDYYKNNLDKYNKSYIKKKLLGFKPKSKRDIDIDYRFNNIVKRLYASCRGSAKKRNLEFSINLGDIIIPTHCPYLGVKLTNIINSGNVPTNPSVDRINNVKGYIPGNIQVISFLANKMKQNATVEELQNFADGINCLHPRVISSLGTADKE